MLYHIVEHIGNRDKVVKTISERTFAIVFPAAEVTAETTP
jgi:hypothetical protein